MEYNYEYVRKCFNNKGYILLEEKYVNMHQRLHYICKRHEEYGIQDTNLQQILEYKKQCKCCKNEDIKNRMQYQIICKEQKYIDICHNNGWIYQGCIQLDNVTYVKYICKLHIKQGIQRIRIDHLLNEIKCPYCNISKGEEKIEQFLISNNIKYKREYKFESCKKIELLRFDFYLPEYNMCIEYNGEQHYIPIDFFGGNEKLKEQQERDNIKRNYCKNNNIKLIEIPYTNFDNIDDILNNTLITVETAG